MSYRTLPLPPIARAPNVHGRQTLPGMRAGVWAGMRVAACVLAVGLMLLAGGAAAQEGQEGAAVASPAVPPQPLAVPLAEAPPQVATLAVPAEPVNDPAEARIDDDEEPSAPAVSSARQKVEVPILVRRLAAGELVGEGDLTWIEVPAIRVRRDTVTDPAEIVGLQARRGVQDGQPLRTGDFRREVLVQKNALVMMSLTTGGMQITAQGKALEDGAQGDVVRVLNPSSKRVVEATVTGPGTVKVAGPPR